MSNQTLSIDQLKRAVAIAEKVQQLETELAAILGGSAPAKVTTGARRGPKPGSKRSTISPEARARMVAGQRARWAKIRGGKSPAKEVKSAEKPATKRGGRRKVSPEARAKMVAAAKKRWAEKKAA